MDGFALDSAIAKVDRAQEHLGTLWAEIDRWMKRGPYALAQIPRLYDDEGAETVTIDSIAASLEPVPMKVGAVLGDVLSNLRSALDHIAWQLVCRELGREPRASILGSHPQLLAAAPRTASLLLVLRGVAREGAVRWTL